MSVDVERETDAAPARSARRRGGRTLPRPRVPSAPRVDVRARVSRGLALARPVARSVGGWVHPVVSVVGPAGWLALGLLVAGTWAGRRVGWAEAWTVAVVCGLLLVIAVGFVVGRSSYHVGLSLGEQRVVVGTRAMGEVTVRNTGSRMTLPARIELPVARGLASFRLPRLAAGADHSDLFAIPTRRRGLVVLGPVRSVRGDPIGLLRRQVRWTEPVDLYVHPRTVSLDGASAGFLRDIEGLPTQDLSSNDIAFHALRDYVAGDDRRSIHWKTTARTGRMVVRQFEETRRSHLVVALSTCTGDYAEPDELELAVSCAASLGQQAIREEKAITAITSRGPLRSTTAIRLLDALSVVESSDRDPGLASLGRAAGTAAPDASAVILVMGSTVEPAAVLAGSVAIPAGALTVALRCAPGAAVSRRTLGGVVLVTVGELAQLPQVMRRVAA